MILKRLVAAAAIAGAVTPLFSFAAEAAVQEKIDIYRYVETSDPYLDQAEATMATDAQLAVDDYVAQNPDAQCGAPLRNEESLSHVHTGTDVSGVKYWTVSATFTTYCLRNGAEGDAG